MEPWYQTLGVIFPGPPPSPIVPNPSTQSQAWVTQWFQGYNQLPRNRTRWTEDGFRALRIMPLVGSSGTISGLPGRVRGHRSGGRRFAGELRLAVRTEAERRGIGWCYWDDGGSFKVRDTRTGTWNEGLRRALLDK